LKYSLEPLDLGDCTSELELNGAYQDLGILRELNGTSKVLGFYRGRELTAIFPGIIDSKTLSFESSPLSYGQGFIYSRKYLGRAASKAVSEPRHLIAALAEWLDNSGILKFSIDLSYGEYDIRPWAWSKVLSGPPVITPRFSARLDLRASSSEIWENLRPVRRQEIKAIPPTEMLISRNECSPGMVASHLSSVLLRGGDGTLGLEASKSIDKIQNLVLGSNIFDTWQFEHARTGDVHFALVARGMREARLIANFTASNAPVRGLSARSTHHLILYYKDNGFEWLDFDGANSPQRGDDKHSYGAKAVMFFNVSGCR